MEESLSAAVELKVDADNKRRIIEHLSGFKHRCEHARNEFIKARTIYEEELAKAEAGELSAYDLVQPGMRY